MAPGWYPKTSAIDHLPPHPHQSPMLLNPTSVLHIWLAGALIHTCFPQYVPTTRSIQRLSRSFNIFPNSTSSSRKTQKHLYVCFSTILVTYFTLKGFILTGVKGGNASSRMPLH